MDSFEAMAIAMGLGVVVLAIVVVFFRPNLGGDYRRGRDEAEYGSSFPYHDSTGESGD